MVSAAQQVAQRGATDADAVADYEDDDERARFLTSGRAADRPAEQREPRPAASEPPRPQQHLRRVHRRIKMLARRDSVPAADCDAAADDAPAETAAAAAAKTEKPPRPKQADRMRLRCVLAAALALAVCCMIAVYCVPFIEIDARAPAHAPVHIPFNFDEGPLRAADAALHRIQPLFDGQVRGPESVAVDSQGNMYLAISGGFVLYAHLNRSAPRRRSYYEYYVRAAAADPAQQARLPAPADLPDLVKIAELNAIKQLPHDANIAPDGTSAPPGAHHGRDRARRQQRTGSAPGGATSWRRECQLDEQLYGQQLSSPAPVPHGLPLDEVLEMSRAPFVSHVARSRCSQPLGVRLSPDERHLYVIDTLSGLYRVHLKVPEKPLSAQRLVTKLIDFRANNGRQYLPVLQYAPGAPGEPPTTYYPTTTTTTTQASTAADAVPVARAAQLYLNVTLKAVDDLAIDYGAGQHGHDLIYLSLASQLWPAHSFVYDMMEMRPTGAVLRYDTGSGHLAVLDPARLSYVRLSAQVELGGGRGSDANGTDYLAAAPPGGATAAAAADQHQLTPPHLLRGYGAPQFDENDIFDDRPLHFANGLELTDDKEALLVADSLNQRIIKHYIRGPRAGTSDLWAWTPLVPDNIRRGPDRRHETYWVAGCGADPRDQLFDTVHLLDNWPTVRKYLLKNIYLLGWLVERLGAHLFHSPSVRDLGYAIKDGSHFMEPFCAGMMVVQYNKHGDIVRSVHSRQFPDQFRLFSQVNEVVDAPNEEHALYLSSPVNPFVAKLTLPSDAGAGPGGYYR